MTALIVALGVAILLLAVLVAGLLRSHAEILRALHELGAGVELDRRASTAPGPVDVELDVREGVIGPKADNTRASNISGVALDGRAAAVRVVDTSSDTLLAFLSSSCLTCAGFWQTFRAGDVRVPGGASLVIVAKSPDDESVSALRKVAPDNLPLVQSSSAWDDYGVPGSPYFVYVSGATGTVLGEGSATSWQQVSDLMTTAVEDVAARPGPGRGGSSGAYRESRADAELLAAGIGPGHPSLYSSPELSGGLESPPER